MKQADDNILTVLPNYYKHEQFCDNSQCLCIRYAKKFVLTMQCFKTNAFESENKTMYI